MSVEFVRCPKCGQKLALQEYVLLGTLVVCANQHCLSNLEVESRKPLRVKLVPIERTFHPDYRPESHG